MTPDFEELEVTSREAADLFGIPVERIYRWRTQKVITPARYLAGPGSPGRGSRGGTPVYRLAEIAEVVHKRHARRTKNREQTPEPTDL